MKKGEIWVYKKKDRKRKINEVIIKNIYHNNLPTNIMIKSLHRMLSAVLNKDDASIKMMTYIIDSKKDTDWVEFGWLDCGEESITVKVKQFLKIFKRKNEKRRSLDRQKK